MLVLQRYKKTIISSILILCIVIISISYPFWGPKDYGKEFLIYGTNGEVVDRSPFPPSIHHPFGTDISGNDVMYLMVDGAKYTILIALFVSLFRVIIGMIFGIVLSSWLSKLIPFLKDFFLPFRYFPALIITLAFMIPVGAGFTGLARNEVIPYQIVVLIFVALPACLFYTTDLLSEWRKKAYVESAYLIGASHFHVIRKHYWPFLKSYGVLLFVQQFFHTLVLLMHLGIFNFFIGGQTQSGLFSGDAGLLTNDPSVFIPSSLSNEWSGLIGQNFKQFMHAPWIVLSSVIGFFFLLVLANTMKKEVERSISFLAIPLSLEEKREEEALATPIIQPDSFHFIEK